MHSNLKPILSLSLWFIFVLGLPMSLLGQDANSKPKPQNIKFSCVVWKNLSLNELYYQQGKEYLPLEPKRGFRSKLYPLKGETALKLFKKEINSEGENVYELVGGANIMEGASEMLFLIEEVPGKRGLPLRVFGIKDSRSDFPPGTYRFVNFTQTNIRAQFGGGNHRIAPRGITEVQPQIPENGGLIPIRMISKKEVIFETRLFSQPNGREMIFIYPSTGARPVSVKFLSQLMGPSK